MTIVEIHEKLIEKKISAVELTRECLKKIEENDKKVNSFLTLTPELALKEAKKAQKIINQGENIPLLCGVPCAIKDNILVEDIRCTAGSKILENYISPFDATVVKKLKGAGAVILGKTNMDEFAMGASTENSAFYPTRNPYDKRRVPGGSSGGSAAAVASDFCAFALGSDTGGSIRQPASFCGLVGLKPTYGSVSRYGLVAMASSLDQIGPITKNVEDTKIVFNAIQGKDQFDSTSVESKIKNQKSKIKNLRIGIPKEYFVEGIEEGVKNKIKSAIEKIRKLGIQVENISLPHTKYALAAYYLIMPSEVSANLARYEGIKYGRSHLPIATLFEAYSKTRGKYLGKEVRRRIVLGAFALSVGYFDEYYLRAQKVRRLIKEDFDKAFLKVDLILTPTSPTVAFKIGERMRDPIKMYLADVFTVGASLAGLPAISLPCGKVDDLPVGLQIIGKAFGENLILKAAEALEKEFQKSK